jgi:hypothetical protein
MPVANQSDVARARHHRVTVPRRHRSPMRGMHHPSKVTPIGATAHFEVSYLTALGKRGANVAQALLHNCERDYSTLRRIFGGLTPKHLPFVVQVNADRGGASHPSCIATDISIGANSGGSVDFKRSLLVQEIDEVFMANFGRGWHCGNSGGEALSRVLAADIYRGAQAADFVSANVWLNVKSRPNWVTRSDASDTHYQSIGCSVLFLNWLRFQLHHSWADIVAAGGRTLSTTYLHLTGKRTGWEDFRAFTQAHFPPGRRYRMKSDNPFSRN